jgi:pSer/pThr/pTyr-binding forkhead associated (FHA) protein
VDEDFILVDLRSQNGTKINSRRIFEAVLQDGDVITLGRIEMKFLRGGGSPASE